MVSVEDLEVTTVGSNEVQGRSVEDLLLIAAALEAAL